MTSDWGVMREMTDIAAAADDPRLVVRRCILITEAPEVGWGDGHACTADEITEAARRELTGS